MSLSEIFEQPPERWGLRGDPYFWEYLKAEHLKRLAGGMDFLSPEGLEEWIKSEHLSLSGEALTVGSRAYIERFAHGGISSGRVSGEWWTQVGIPYLKERLRRGRIDVIRVSFRRRSVCMGDDAGNGEYIIEMPHDATLGGLIGAVFYGLHGNSWPIPYTGADSRSVIRSNIGDLARIYTDPDGEWHIEYTGPAEKTPLEGLGIERVFGEQE